MIIDNQKTIISRKIQKLFLAILTGAVIVIILTTNIIGDGFLELSRKNWAVIVASLYLIYYIYQIIIEPYYIYFSDDGEKIVLRYYSAGALGSKKSAIEIPKNQFHNFHTKKVFINHKEKLTLYQRTSKGIFKYPPISLSALNLNEKNILKNTLKKYAVNQ